MQTTSKYQTLKFQGITHVVGDYGNVITKLRERLSVSSDQDRNLFCEIAIKENPYPSQSNPSPQGEGVILDGADMAAYLKVQFNITVPDSLTTTQTQREMLNEIAQNMDSRIAIGEYLMRKSSEGYNARVFAYYQNCLANNTDASGQPIVNITV
jgi:hypothetical protein